MPLQFNNHRCRQCGAAARGISLSLVAAGVTSIPAAVRAQYPMSQLVPAMQIPPAAARVDVSNNDVRMTAGLLGQVLASQHLHSAQAEALHFPGSGASGGETAFLMMLGNLERAGYTVTHKTLTPIPQNADIILVAKKAGATPLVGLIRATPLSVTLVWSAVAPGAASAATAPAPAPNRAPSRVATVWPHSPAAAAGPRVAAATAPRVAPMTPARPPAMNVGSGDFYWHSMVFAMGGISYEHIYLDHGRVYHSTPPDGADPVNWSEVARIGKPEWNGTYTISGGKMHVRWQNGKTDDWDYKLVNDHELDIHGESFTKSPKLAPGHKLDGTFNFATFISMGAIGGGHVNGMHDSRFTFHTDGTFDSGESGGGTSTSGNGAVGNGTYVQGAQARGRYYIWGNTLLMQFPDGRQEKHIIYVYPGDENKSHPSLLGIDGKMLG